MMPGSRANFADENSASAPFLTSPSSAAGFSPSGLHCDVERNHDVTFYPPVSARGRNRVLLISNRSAVSAGMRATLLRVLGGRRACAPGLLARFGEPPKSEYGANRWDLFRLSPLLWQESFVSELIPPPALASNIRFGKQQVKLMRVAVRMGSKGT